MPATLDHLPWGCRDLDVAIADLHERSGVRAMYGGLHPELGTPNAVARLADRVFLEVIAPAPPTGGSRAPAGAVVGTSLGTPT